MPIVKTRILMVCLGNICRSPLAEGIMLNLIQHENLEHRVEVDSAGTAGHCVGSFPDERSIRVALDHGISLNHKARQFGRRDFSIYDHILVMDESNYEDVIKLAKNHLERSKVKLITDFDHRGKKPKIVADPYHGSFKDFQNVFDQLVHCCEGWLRENMKAQVS